MNDKPNVRIEIQADHEAASSYEMATAYSGEQELHRIRKCFSKHITVEAISEARAEMFKELVEWLRSNGYPTPDHYWLQQYM